MRKLIAVAIHDMKIGEKMTPIFVATELMAIRSFQTAVNEEGHEFAQHAEDYSLWVVGEWDPQESSDQALKGCEHRCVARGFDLVEESGNE